MLIKKAFQGEFRYLLSILRLAVLDNRSYVIFQKKKFNYFNILATLRTEGFIESFEDRGEIIVIGLKQIYWKSFRHPVHAFSFVEPLRLNKRFTASAKQLTKYQLRQGLAQHISVSTDRGVLTGQEISAKNIGGMPLFKLY